MLFLARLARVHGWSRALPYLAVLPSGAKSIMNIVAENVRCRQLKVLMLMGSTPQVNAVSDDMRLNGGWSVGMDDRAIHGEEDMSEYLPPPWECSY